MNRRIFLALASAAAATACTTTEPVMKRSNKLAASRRVLWAANVRTKSLDDRLVAAQASGFDAMSVFPIDF